MQPRPRLLTSAQIAADRTAPRGAEIGAQNPFNRVALPEEVAAAIVWLASPQAQWASGTVLDLNGASYLRT